MNPFFLCSESNLFLRSTGAPSRAPHDVLDHAADTPLSPFDDYDTDVVGGRGEVKGAHPDRLKNVFG